LPFLLGLEALVKADPEGLPIITLDEAIKIHLANQKKYLDYITSQAKFDIISSYI
jgi:hypothetical protein